MNFLFPAGLGLAALAVPLAALYFLRLRRRKVRVPSLLPWHALQKTDQLSSPFHRFRRNLLLWVQLAILALLVLAAARPFLETDTAEFRSVVLVLDTSASMGARDVAPTVSHRPGSRLDHARDEAARIVADLGSGDEVMVVAAGPRTEVVVPFTRDHDAAARALPGIAVTEAEGGLGEALELAASLARSRTDVEIVVLSDGGGEALGALPSFSGARVRFVRIGEGDTNAGIVALDLRSSPVSELNRQLFVTVRSFGAAPVDGAVEVWLDDRLAGLRSASLAPDAPISMVFDCRGDRGRDPRGPAPLRRGPAPGRRHRLGGPAADRRARGPDGRRRRAARPDPRERPAGPRDPDRAERGHAGAPRRRRRGAVRGRGPGQRRRARLRGPGPAPRSPVKFGDEVEGPRITGWQRTHPILRFTRWDDVVIGAARAVTDKGGLSTLVDASHGPLVLAGQRNGGRVVQLAFDPLQTNLPLRVGWPILVMNVVGWLTEDALGGDAGECESHRYPFVRHLAAADADAAPTVRGPGDAEAAVAGGTLRIGRTDRVGVYDVTAGGTRARFAANLLSERESRIAPRQALSLASGDTAPAEDSVAVSRRGIWRPLLIAAAVLLCGEWLLWNLRRAA